MSHVRTFGRAAVMAAAIATSTLALAGPPGGLRYVDDDAPPGGDGRTWETAYTHLQDALTEAGGGGVHEVRIGQGRYAPDRSEEHPDGTGDRDATFGLVDGLALVGGYAGFGEPDPDQRDIEAYETVLTGDLAGDDTPDFAGNGENSFHVLTAEDLAVAPRLDGLTISAGNADGEGLDNRGGGLIALDTSPVLVACTVAGNMARRAAGVSAQGPLTIEGGRFAGNAADGFGGAIVADSLIATGASFSWNEAEGGGAIVAWERAEISDCTFVGNRSASDGGAVATDDLVLRRSVFRNNEAASFGGAVYATGDGPSLVEESVFEENRVLEDRAGPHGGGAAPLNVSGGGAIFVRSPATIRDSTFIGNTARQLGGAINASGYAIEVEVCSFLNNSSDRGGALGLQGSDGTTVVGSVFTSNAAESGGAIYLVRAGDVSVADCAFRSNVATEGGAVHVGRISAGATFVRSAFTGNSAVFGGGVFVDSSSTDVRHSTFIANEANDGGAIYAFEAELRVEACGISANTAPEGGGLYLLDTTTAIVDTTLTHQTSVFGGAAYVEGGAVAFTGTDVESNVAAFGAGIYHDGGTLTMRDAAFRANQATIEGGAAWVGAAGILEATDCTFDANDALDAGGALHLADASAYLLRCTIDGGAARYGAGVFATGTTARFRSCVFRFNDAGAWGGAISAESCEIALADCTAGSNAAGEYGGALFLDEGSLIAAGGRFDGNASEHGGAIALANATAALVDIEFSSNRADDRGGAIDASGAAVTVDGSRFLDNVAGRAGAILSRTVLNVRDSVFARNTAERGGGAVECLDPATFVACHFNENAADDGGALSSNDPLDVRRSTFVRNTADRGGAIDCGDEAILVSCLFDSNTARFGGAMSVSVAGGDADVVSCTLVGNTADAYGAIRARGDCRVAGAIVRDSGPMPLDDGVTVVYSNIEGGHEGVGNIDADPRFVDRDGPDGMPGTEDDDLRLAAGSPCIDAGDNDAVPADAALDLGGQARFVDDPATPDSGRGAPPLIDMGAYEYQAGPCPADIDGNGAVDFEDLLRVLDTWGDEGGPEDLDGSGVVDFGDLLIVLDSWGPCE